MRHFSMEEHQVKDKRVELLRTEITVCTDRALQEELS